MTLRFQHPILTLLTIQSLACRPGATSPVAQPIPTVIDAGAVEAAKAQGFTQCEYSQPTPPLHSAVLAHDGKKIEALLSSGVSIDARNECGETPLMWAFALEVSWPTMSMHPSRASIAKESRRMERENAARMKTAIWLLDHGANPTAIDKRGNNVLAHAAAFGSGGPALLVIVDRLVESGASVSQTNYEGDTPLMRAVWSGRVDVASRLIARGASTAHKNIAGKSALDIAKESNRLAMIKLLYAH
jgi:ankyrin repeat protein